MARPFYRKIISKTLDIVSDIQSKHHSDTVLHSKNLIELLVFYALKQLGDDTLRFARNSDELKLERLMDKNYISERIYDNCLNTKGLRNPTEHIFTFPNEHFAKGSALASLELFYALQHKLSLPEVPELDALAKSLGVQPLHLLHLTSNKYITSEDLFLLKGIFSGYPGPYMVILDFMEGIVHPNGIPATGFKLDETVGYSSELEGKLQGVQFVTLEWAGVEIFESLPHLDKYDKARHPSLSKN